jgi:Pentapeptide repeats (8 copies)
VLFEFSSRLENLSFGHHREAMAAPPEDRQWWLERGKSIRTRARPAQSRNRSRFDCIVSGAAPGILRTLCGYAPGGHMRTAPTRRSSRRHSRRPPPQARWRTPQQARVVVATQEHVDRLRTGVKEWNAWRLDDPTRPVDLRGADLRGATLSGANLTGAPPT